MRHWSRGMLALCVVAGLAASLFISRGVFARSPSSHAGKAPPTGAASGISSSLVTCGSHWRLASSPYANGQTMTELASVATVSANDVWAVGYDWLGYGSGLKGIVEHWNGTAWSIVSFQMPQGATDVAFYGVGAVSSSDVWAVGSYADSTGVGSALIEHWDGASWSIVPPGLSGGGLSSIAVISADDIWAAGGMSGTTLALHWNGTVWSRVGTVDPLYDDGFMSISAATTNGVWAVGYGETNGPNESFTEHWDGTAWSVVPSPPVGSGENIFRSVSAIAANDAWVVGYYYAANVNQDQTLIEHWNGTAWNVVPSPNGFVNGSALLFGVTALSPSDIWAVGNYLGPGPNNGVVQQALTEHWNGSAWSIIPATNPSTFNNFLYGVTAVTSNDVWAVGGFTSGQSGQVGNTLIEHYPALFVGVQGAPGAPPRTSAHGPSGAILCQ